jgi:uncharacterized membrane protein
MNDKFESDPKFWKWGIVYFNLKDSRIIIPKRTGIGWTLNFAHPTSLLWLAALILLVLILR